MTLAFWFWLIWVVWFFFGAWFIWWPQGRFYLGGYGLLWLLLFILGLKVFGNPLAVLIHG